MNIRPVAYLVILLVCFFLARLLNPNFDIFYISVDPSLGIFFAILIMDGIRREVKHLRTEEIETMQVISRSDAKWCGLVVAIQLVLTSAFWLLQIELSVFLSVLGTMLFYLSISFALNWFLGGLVPRYLYKHGVLKEETT
ncbi:MAG: hypothetical protein ACFFED_05420 [Candidatus Thorarchaeota archaeon]